MKKTFLNKVRDLLTNEKNELLNSSSKELDIDTDGDETDEIQGKLLIGITQQLNVRNAERLIQIEEAFKRIDNQTYGVCQDCEEVIPEKRLLHNPYFKTCISCAEEREMSKKQRKSK